MPKNNKPNLKKSGAEKLNKINRTTSTADISFALRHGKITKQEAAALDPKNFKILLDNSKTKTIATIDVKTGKVTKGGSPRIGRGGGGGAGLGGPLSGRQIR